MICDHWRNIGIRCGGECAAGVFKQPSFGACLRHCTARVIDGKPQTPNPNAELPDCIDKPAPTRITPALLQPTAPPNDLQLSDVLSFFDRAVVISLARTPERTAAFWSRLANYPFVKPETFVAIDGEIARPPNYFEQGGGAWGCLRSHLSIIERALCDGVQRLLIMEDDCAWAKGAKEAMRDFLSRVPSDWHCIMPGGQQHDDGQTILIAPGIRKVSQCERTHCYAFSREGMLSIYQWYSRGTNQHCDWMLGDWQESGGVNCYRPDPFVAYQVENFSTIRWQYEPRRDFEADYRARKPEDVPVVILKCPQSALDQLRRRGVAHTGYWRDGRDVDKGIADADDDPQKIADVVNVLRKEAAGFDNAIVGLWHPDKAVPFEAPTIEGGSADEVAFRIKLMLRERAPWNVTSPAVFYHVACMNNWRDVVKEQCELLARVGLTKVFAGIVGDGRDCVQIAKDAGIQLSIVAHDPDVLRYETPTIKQVHEWARQQSHPAACLYLHTKGVSKPGDRNKMLWRRLMQRELVSKWREHLPKLKMLDAIGVNFQESPRYPHFSGNFWMARSDWLSILPDPLEYQKSQAGTILAYQPWERICSEMWIGSKNWHKIESLVTKNAGFWSGDAILQFEPLPVEGCSRCGSSSHTINECPVPEDLSVDDARAALLRSGCCDPP